MASIEYVVNATGNLSAFMEKAALTTDRLNEDLEKLSKRVATPNVDLNDADAVLKVARFTARLDKLAEKIADPKITLEGTQKATLELYRLNAQLDRLDHKGVTATVKVDVDRSFLSRVRGMFGVGGGGGGGLIGSLLGFGAGGAQAGGAGAAGISGVAGLIPGGQAALYGGAGLLAAILGPAAIPLLLGGGVGLGGGILGATIGAKGTAAIAADQKALQAAQAAIAGSKKGGSAAQRLALARAQRQLALDQSKYGDVLPYGQAVSGLGQSALGSLLDALSGRPVVGTMAGPGRTGQPVYGQSFLGGLIPVLKQIQGFIKAIGPSLGDLFRASLPYVSTFVGVLEQFTKTILPVLTNMLNEMVQSGALTIIAQGFAAIGQGVADFFKALGPQGMKDSAKLFTDFAKTVGFTLTILGKAFNFVAVAVQDTAHFMHETWNRNMRDLESIRHHIAVIFDGIRHDIAHWWDMAWDNTIGRLKRGIHDIVAFDEGLRHHIANVYDGIRHDIAHYWDVIWNNTIGRLKRGIHDAAALFDGWRHNISHWFDVVRGDIAHAWDVIWANTITKITNGVATVVSWFKGLPGRIENAVSSLLGIMTSFGSTILTDFLNGVKSVWTTVSSWFSGLPGKILSALGIKSPPKWAVDAGTHIMNGILKGLAHGKDVKSFFLGLVNDITGPLKNVWASLFGDGKFPTGVAQYTATAAAVLRALGQPLSDLGVVMAQMNTESGGNPYSVNKTDSNWAAGHPSVGLMQVIAGTFGAYAGPFRGTGPFEYGVSVNPMANIFAGLNYAIHRYGAGWTSVLGQGHGYDAGGWLMPGATLAINRTGRPERVLPPGADGGINIYVTVPPTVNPQQAGQQIAQLILAHTKAGGRLYPQGVAPR